jgi:hypothetical protein
MGLDLTAPDHTTLSRRNRDVEVPKPSRLEDGPIRLIVDSSGLKIAGKGEWHVQKHGVKARRGWRKLHIGVDADGFIVASPGHGGRSTGEGRGAHQSAGSSNQLAECQRDRDGGCGATTKVIAMAEGCAAIRSCNNAPGHAGFERPIVTS